MTKHKECSKWDGKQNLSNTIKHWNINYLHQLIFWNFTWLCTDLFYTWIMNWF